MRGDKAKEEAEKLFSIKNNLLDKSVEKDEKGMYPLYMQSGMDIASAMHDNPDLKKEYENLTVKANDSSYDRENLVKEISAFSKEAFNKADDRLRFDSYENLFEDLEKIVEKGAKGSKGKVDTLARYTGVSYERDENGKINMDTFKVSDKTYATAEDYENTNYAVAVKAFGTGIAGTFSQKGMAALRNLAPDEILNLTYPVTQSVLQAKHDPVEAAHKYAMLNSTVKELWQGKKLQKVTDKAGNISWKAFKDDTGKTYQATPEEFRQQFTDIYTSKEGLDVAINTEAVDIITEKLTGSDGNIINAEEGKGLRSPMDRLAYGGSYETLKELAENKENLFDGKNNSSFAPRVIKNNIIKLKNMEDLEPLTKSDTKDRSYKNDVTLDPYKRAEKSSQTENPKKTYTYGEESLISVDDKDERQYAQAAQL